MVTAPTKRTGRKRGNNEGTIRQRGDGSWEGRVSLPDGKRKSFYAKTRAEVQRKMTAALRDVQQGLPVPTGRLTFGAFLNQWLAEVVEPNLAPKTHRSYEQNVRTHIAPALGRLPLPEVTPPRIQRFLNTKRQAGLSPRTVQILHALLRQALGQALDWRLVTVNAATLIPTPRATRFKAPALSATDARAVLDAFSGDRLEGLVTVVLSLGVRQGEALGLRWSDVDLDAATLTVPHQLQRVRGEWQLRVPKTTRSERTIPLPSVVVTALRKQRVQQLEERLAAGEGWKGNAWDLVFTTTVGTPLDGVKVTRRFQAMLDRAGLQRLRFHDLRHGAASLLLAQGVPLPVVMAILGHNQVATTLHYSHAVPELTRDAMNRMDLALGAGG
jgi:integrase